jgi:hypothetical protein
MADYAPEVPGAESWDPTNAAVFADLLQVGAGAPVALALRHPTYPYAGEWDGRSQDALFAFASGYLARVGHLFGLPAGLAVAGEAGFAPSDQGLPLGWLPVSWGSRDVSPEPDDARESRWVEHFDRLAPEDAAGGPDAPAPALLDRTLTLLAVQTLDGGFPGGARFALRSGIGIGVLARVVQVGAGALSVRIVGAWANPELAASFSPGAPGIRGLLAGQDREAFHHAFASDRIRHGLAQAAGLAPDRSLWISGYRLLAVGDDTTVAQVWGSVSTGPRGEAPYLLSGRVTFATGTNALAGRVESVRTERTDVHAAPARANLFGRDPASLAGEKGVVGARPTREPRRLGTHRSSRVLPGLTAPAPGTPIALDDGDGYVRVMRSAVVDPAADPTLPVSVALDAITDARVHEFAAASAYRNVRRGFDAMLRSGLDPKSAFAFADLPVRVRYRDRMKHGPGRDGRAVNALVDFEPPAANLLTTAPSAGASRPLEVRFALGDLLRTQSRRHLLGVAADPRWAWHEFGHVVLAAATGELEFPFAHSVGDALAAIASDPDSRLATNPELRGLTFPWVYLHRRHDRPVGSGWSWSGRRHRRTRFPTIASPLPRKGYESEQILSTTLFRLYRALGGDTQKRVRLPAGGSEWVPDASARRRASDYVLYLVLRALLTPGWAGNVPIAHAEQFAALLMLVDAVTSTQGGRVGGCAHKVVRSAFEAQGMYAVATADEVIDAPGEPPDVDVYIDDRRPDAEGAHPRGAYVPVSLDWRTGDAPWHAAPGAIRVAGNGVTVEVRNRGRRDAKNVQVAVYVVGGTTVPTAPPPWKGGAWVHAGTAPKQTVPAGDAPVAFGPIALPGGATARLVLAVATCPRDRANADPATGLDCALKPTPLIDLVSGDNNLGLRVLP